MLDTLYKKRVTISDVAAKAGVTQSTVSMVLRNKDGISQVTRHHVMKIAKAMQYTTFPTRQTRGKSQWAQIAFVIISKENPPPNNKLPTHYFPHMTQGCSAYAAEKGYCMIYSHLDWRQIKEGKFSTVLSHGYIDGFLIRAWLSPEVIKVIEKINVPVILMDCDRYLDNYSSIQINNIKAIDLIVEHLVKQGAKRFATITGDLEHQNAQERLAGLQMALNRRRIPLPPEAIIEESNFGSENGRRGVSKLLENGYKFDALVCHYDLVAYGAIEQLLLAGIKVPDDVRVTGFDNDEFSSKIAIPLTTIETNSYNIGQQGAQMLMDQISGGRNRILHVHSDVSLVVRESA